MRIARIVSGGQTGAEQGAWFAAVCMEMPYGGTVPNGRRTELGPLRDYFAGYTGHASSEYIDCAETNALTADASLVFSYGPPSPLLMPIIGAIRKHTRPCLLLDLREPRLKVVLRIVSWVRQICPQDCTLYVTGSRESQSPSIQTNVATRMCDAMARTNGTRLGYWPMPDETVEQARTDWKGVIAKRIDDIRHRRPTYHPKSVDEASRILIRLLSPENRLKVRAMSLAELQEGANFGVCMEIRNRMMHGNRRLPLLLADAESPSADDWSLECVGFQILNHAWELLRRSEEPFLEFSP
jgi:hypothetical protein